MKHLQRKPQRKKCNFGPPERIAGRGTCGKTGDLVENSWPRAERLTADEKALTSAYRAEGEGDDDACAGVVSRDARGRATGAGPGPGGTQARTRRPAVC